MLLNSYIKGQSIETPVFEILRFRLFNIQSTNIRDVCMYLHVLHVYIVIRCITYYDVLRREDNSFIRFSYHANVSFFHMLCVQSLLHRF